MRSKYNIKQATCNICERKYYAKGYCRKHYNNYLAGRVIEPKPCKNSGCSTKVLRPDRSYCAKHYSKREVEKRREERYASQPWKYTNYKKYIKHKKQACELCKAFGYNMKLYMHHKDENKNNPDLNNLITVCSKCHGKIHSNKYLGNKTYVSLYGFTLKEIAKRLELTLKDINFLHSKGLLRKNLEQHKNLF